MGVMLSKDSVKNRLSSEDGMSFTEFAYQTLQGYDFLHLYDNHGVTLQMGGSDQWGNILAGTELIKKVRGLSVHGLTFPLLTKSDGQKFGKSEKGAIWLSPDKLSPYEFYQYLYRVADADVIKLLKYLTFIDMKEIHEYENILKNSSSAPNIAQKTPRRRSYTYCAWRRRIAKSTSHNRSCCSRKQNGIECRDPRKHCE